MSQTVNTRAPQYRATHTERRFFAGGWMIAGIVLDEQISLSGEGCRSCRGGGSMGRKRRLA
jgi:hypothetical protein